MKTRLRPYQPEPHNAHARYVAEFVKASRVKAPRRVEIECGRLLVTGSDLKAQYFKFVAAAAKGRRAARRDHDRRPSGCDARRYDKDGGPQDV
jgi:hypothetical protein